MNRAERVIHACLAGIGLASIAIFAMWWFNPHHLPNNFHGIMRIADVLLFMIVSYAIWHPIMMRVLSWAIASHIKQPSNKKPSKKYKVAFITTFVPSSESTELLHKCLPAMVAADYDHDTWLLDEGDSAEARRICESYGVKHFTRHDMEHYNTPEGKYARKTKGGNHNAWYEEYGNEYDIVAQIDTDFVPSKGFLTKTLGHFSDPKVAFVGTPQVYGNDGESFIARGAAEQTYSFYGPILSGLYGMEHNSTLIGANHVIRVKALKDVDHYSAHITEDLLTGMKLHAKGWKSVYVPEPLAIGEGPSTWQSYFNQQMRWAYGCMHILLHITPKLVRGMSKRRAIYYILLQQHYFTGMAMIMGVTGLTLYFLFNLHAADVSLEPFLATYIPVLLTSGMMTFWLQRFNVRPNKERGMLVAGKIIGIASWPIFFLAFLGVVTGKKLTYKVTPKGANKTEINEDSLGLFIPHVLFASIVTAAFSVGMHYNRTAPIMVFWALTTALLLVFVPFSQTISNLFFSAYGTVTQVVRSINAHYRIFELRAFAKSELPSAPTDFEKYSYTHRNFRLLLPFSLISFALTTYSMSHFIAANPVLWSMFVYLILTIAYYLVSLIVTVPTRGFDLNRHRRLVFSWRPKRYPSVDVFLPTAGEDTAVLRNTWEGVTELQKYYKGKLIAWVLDDSARDKVSELASQFGFEYVVRPNRGEFKKAGNLRHGYKISKGKFIVIFDADFRPRHDFLNELLPYMYDNERLGIVQSPQFFDVNDSQNWLERGAGAVQELFYRHSQVSRQNHQAAICVGSNAIYRRRALKDTGGTALIEHSEDVHTGVNLRQSGWYLQYVPVVLAKGLCPDAMPAFFKQQYRWCMGSMSLLGSKKFWQLKLPLRARMSYMSGFMYYVHTAITSVITPVVPLYILLAEPEVVTVGHMLLIIPSMLFVFVVFPAWHNAVYGVEAWATRVVYGWAHLFAVFDAVSRRRMSWQPTGAVKGRDYRYITFRTYQIMFNLIPGILWMSLAMQHLLVRHQIAFAVMFASGTFYTAIALKVALYTTKQVRFLGSARMARQSAVAAS